MEDFRAGFYENSNGQTGQDKSLELPWSLSLTASAYACRLLSQSAMSGSNSGERLYGPIQAIMWLAPKKSAISAPPRPNSRGQRNPTGNQ